MTAKPYLDPAGYIKTIIETEETKRTGAVIASTYGTITVIDHRIVDWDEITENLPCITVDLHAEAVEYIQEDQTVYRLIPMTIVVYIPIMTRNLSDDEARVEELKADVEIRTIYGDLEEVLNSTRTRQQVAQAVILLGGGGIFQEAFDWDDLLGIKMRIGQINVAVKSLVR